MKLQSLCIYFGPLCFFGAVCSLLRQGVSLEVCAATLQAFQDLEVADASRGLRSEAKRQYTPAHPFRMPSRIRVGGGLPGKTLQF